MIDLHTHSSASDGSLSPRELIAAAAKRGLTAIALTDHDTINGLEDAKAEAERLQIRFIPGIEIDIDRGSPAIPGDFHLLGLNLSRLSPDFVQKVASAAKRREERNLLILDKMKELSIPGEYEEIAAFSGGHSIGRPHFAAFLVSRHIVKTAEQAFSLYLGKGKPLYVPKTGMNFDDALAIIKASGGVPVLAHPMSLYIAWGQLPNYIQNLKERGLEGIEAWHPTATVRACIRLEMLGKSLGLRISAGSDFHGKTRLDRKLGFTAGNRKIEDRFLDVLAT